MSSRGLPVLRARGRAVRGGLRGRAAGRGILVPSPVVVVPKAKPVPKLPPKAKAKAAAKPAPAVVPVIGVPPPVPKAAAVVVKPKPKPAGIPTPVVPKPSAVVNATKPSFASCGRNAEVYVHPDEAGVLEFCKTQSWSFVVSPHALRLTTNPHWKDALTRRKTLQGVLADCVETLSRESSKTRLRLLDLYGSPRTGSICAFLNSKSSGPFVDVSVWRPVLTPADEGRLPAGVTILDSAVQPSASGYDFVLLNDIYQCGDFQFNQRYIKTLLQQVALVVWIGHSHLGVAGRQGRDGYWFREGENVVCFPDDRNEPYIMPPADWIFTERPDPGLGWQIKPTGTENYYSVLFRLGNYYPHTHYARVPEVGFETLRCPSVPDNEYSAMWLELKLRVSQSLVPWGDSKRKGFVCYEVRQELEQSISGATLTRYQINKLLGSPAVQKNWLLTHLRRVKPELVETIERDTCLSAYERVLRKRHSMFGGLRYDGGLLSQVLQDEMQMDNQSGKPWGWWKTLVPLVATSVAVVCRKAGLGLKTLATKTSIAIARRPLVSIVSLLVALCSYWLLNIIRRARIRQRNQTAVLLEEFKQQVAGNALHQRLDLCQVSKVGVFRLEKRQVQAESVELRQGALVTGLRAGLSKFTDGGTAGAKTYRKLTGFSAPFYMAAKSSNNAWVMLQRVIREPPLMPVRQAQNWHKRKHTLPQLCPPFPAIPLLNFRDHWEWVHTCIPAKRKLYLEALHEIQLRPVVLGDVRIKEPTVMPKTNELQYADKQAVRSIVNSGPVIAVSCGPYVEECTTRLKTVWTIPRDQQPINCHGLRVYLTWGSGFNGDGLSSWANTAMELPANSVAIIAGGDDSAVIWRKRDGSFLFLEGDFSQFDQSQSFCAIPDTFTAGTPLIWAGPLENSLSLLNLLGCPTSVVAMLRDAYQPVLRVPNPAVDSEMVKVDLRTTPLLPTGVVTTTFNNTVNTLTSWAIVFDVWGRAMEKSKPAELASVVEAGFKELGLKIKLKCPQTVFEMTFLKGIFLPATVLRETGRHQEIVWGVLPCVAMKFGYAKVDPSSIFSRIKRMFGPEACDKAYLSNIANGWRDGVQTPVVRAIVKRWANAAPFVSESYTHKDTKSTTRVLAMDFSYLCQRYHCTLADFENLEAMIAQSDLGTMIWHPLLYDLAQDYA